MRIVLCKGQFIGPISGADETIVTYATQLKKAGHSPSVLLIYPHSRTDPYYLRLREAGVPVETIAPSSVSASLTVSRKLMREVLRAIPSAQPLIRRGTKRITTNLVSHYFEPCRDLFLESSPDVVHVMTPDPAAMILIRAAAAARVPVIYQELGMPYHPTAFAEQYREFTSVIPLCSIFAALSPLLARLCLEQLPLFDSPSILPIMTEDSWSTQRVTHQASSRIRFGFAARIEELKGSQVLAEAFAHTHRRYPDIYLHIAGAGSQKEKIHALLKSFAIDDLCKFHGIYTRPEQKRDFMSGIDIFVLPSYTEGTPNSIIEAMSHGVPVIGTSVGGISDVVTPDVGIIVKPGDTVALSEAMYRLATDGNLRARMGAAARRRYEMLFAPQRVLPVMIRTYEKAGAKLSGEAGGLKEPEHPWEAVEIAANTAA